jgi:hypothetical protein
MFEEKNALLGTNLCWVEENKMADHFQNRDVTGWKWIVNCGLSSSQPLNIWGLSQKYPTFGQKNSFETRESQGVKVLIIKQSCHKLKTLNTKKHATFWWVNKLKAKKLVSFTHLLQAYIVLWLDYILRLQTHKR